MLTMDNAKHLMKVEHPFTLDPVQTSHHFNIVQSWTLNRQQLVLDMFDEFTLKTQSVNLI